MSKVVILKKMVYFKYSYLNHSSNDAFIIPTSLCNFLDRYSSFE